MIKGALEHGDALLCQVKIYGGGFYGGMSQKAFNGIYISAVGQKMCGKGMS